MRLDRVEWGVGLVRLEILLWERADSRLKDDHDLPLSSFEALHFVSLAPEASMRVGDLAKALRVTVGGTSKLVDRVTKAGLLSRQVDPDDRRAARVALTAAGEQTLIAARKTYDAVVGELLNGVLTPTEQERMRDYLARLLAAATEGQP